MISEAACYLQARPGGNVSSYWWHSTLVFSSGMQKVLMHIFDRDSLTLKEGDFLGDMALLGKTDWSLSTCLHLVPSEADGKGLTEIQVSRTLILACQTLNPQPSTLP